MMRPHSYVFLGLSITSSWGNSHATTYRGLLKHLHQRGHRVAFLERDLPGHEQRRDLARQPYPYQGQVELYASFDDLTRRFTRLLREADLVVVGSSVPEGAKVGAFAQATTRGKTAFYDLDPPRTLRELAAGNTEHLEAAQIPAYDLYLSFTGGPMLELLERGYGARRARPLYGSVDPEHYYPERAAPRWDLGYLGTYSEDRRPSLGSLLLEPARRFPRGRFIVAGAQYPRSLSFPRNVDRSDHVPPSAHRTFYNAQRFTLNVTRSERIAAGYSPGTRLFEAAACGVPVVSDEWPGLEELFEPGREILLARSPEESLLLLRELPEAVRLSVGRLSRARVLGSHTAAHRAEALERYTEEIR